jgi:membrane protein DedA with SNARE-associated domain
VSELESYLTLIPPVAVYLIVGLVVGIESLGVPLPGEIVLVGAALLASRQELEVFPVWIAVAGPLASAARRRAARLVWDDAV